MHLRTATHALYATVVAITITGCVNSNFTRTSSIETPPRPDDCYLDVVLDGKPGFAYVVIGRVTTDAVKPDLFAIGESEQSAFERLEQKACKAGAHVIFAVETSSDGHWDDDGFSRSTRGSAVAAVYVDEHGKVLPPPTAPMNTVQLPVRPTAGAVPAPRCE